MKYAVFLDIDGTLLVSTGIPAANKAAIRRARENGHKVFINTGRSLAHIPDFIRDTGEYDGIVAGLGSLLLYNEKILYSNPIPQEFVEKVFPMVQGRVCVFEGEQHSFCTPEWLQLTGNGADIAKTAEEIRGNKISTICINEAVSDEEYALFSQTCTVYRHTGYTEMAIKGTSKSLGMRRMTELLAGEFLCMAMGDSCNDMDMLQAADVSVAMGDSTEEVKTICDYVSCDAADGGVAKALEHFGLI